MLTKSQHMALCTLIHDRIVDAKALEFRATQAMKWVQDRIQYDGAKDHDDVAYYSKLVSRYEAEITVLTDILAAVNGLDVCNDQDQETVPQPESPAT